MGEKSITWKVISVSTADEEDELERSVTFSVSVSL